MSNFIYQVVDPEYGNYYTITTLGYTAIAIMILLLLLGACFLSNQKQSLKFSTKQLAFAAMCLSLGYIASMLKISDLPMGGSATLMSMFFISYTGYLFGLRKGLLIAATYGCLQLFQDPWIISIPQLLFDYIFAFAALGLSGIFFKKKSGLLLGYLTGVAGRFVFCFLSGVIFFASYAEGSGFGVYLYSFLYNISYIGIEAFITIFVISLPPVKKALAHVKKLATT